MMPFDEDNTAGPDFSFQSPRQEMLPFDEDNTAEPVDFSFQLSVVSDFRLNSRKEVDFFNEVVKII
jgi:hypothetical protein